MKYPEAKIKSVGVDFDDFVVVSKKVKTAQHIAVARDAFGVTITQEDVWSVWGRGLRFEMATYYGHPDPANVTERQHEKHLAAYNARSAEYPKTLLPGAKEAMERIARSGLPFFMLTSLLRANAVEEMQQVGVDPDMFMMIEGSDTSPAIKPDPAAFDNVITGLVAVNVEPHSALYGGDALSDARASTGAGMHFMGVPSGSVSAVDFARNGFSSVPTIQQFAGYALYVANR